MIGCDKCEEWFHAKCFNINLLEIPDIEHFDFLCPDCQKKSGDALKQADKTVFDGDDSGSIQIDTFTEV